MRQNSSDRCQYFQSVERYRIPPDNPWVGVAGARPEIYAMGFRNPWRFSIDPTTRRLWVGDVGGSRFEEVNLIQADGGLARANANFGWDSSRVRNVVQANPA